MIRRLWPVALALVSLAAGAAGYVLGTEEERVAPSATAAPLAVLGEERAFATIPLPAGARVPRLPEPEAEPAPPPETAPAPVPEPEPAAPAPVPAPTPTPAPAPAPDPGPVIVVPAD